MRTRTSVTRCNLMISSITVITDDMTISAQRILLRDGAALECGRMSDVKRSLGGTNKSANMVVPVASEVYIRAHA